MDTENITTAVLAILGACLIALGNIDKILDALLKCKGKIKKLLK